MSWFYCRMAADLRIKIDDRANSRVAVASGSGVGVGSWREILRVIHEAAEITTGEPASTFQGTTTTVNRGEGRDVQLELVKNEDTTSLNVRSSETGSSLVMRLFDSFFQRNASREDNVSITAPGKLYHEQWTALAAWFLGPKAENIGLFNSLAEKAFKGNADFRSNYFPTDANYITPKLKRSDVYIKATDRLKEELDKLIERLKNSVPNASIRYQAHMCWDTTLPSNLGYLAALLYNSNNVANEASPVTTEMEIQVGRQLCEMLGYRSSNPKPWGHITADGSIANIEAMWTCRNLKFYPLAVQKALSDERMKKARNYQVFVPRLDRKNKLTAISAWDALNLLIDDVVRMPIEVMKLADIDNLEYSDIVDKYSIAYLGISDFMKVHKLRNDPVVLGPRSVHYSWPKAATMLGLGQRHLLPIEYDKHARMDKKDLRKKLLYCLKNEIPVISVIVVLGTTEESAVDPLADIVELRVDLRRSTGETGQLMGMNFAINADAAWGGYFMTMLIDSTDGTDAGQTCGKETGCIPVCPLSNYTKDQLRSMKHADTITVDPHKSGFCPYPAGGLCYRNGDMKRFIKIEADVVYHEGADPSVGIWGVEGSKPGAAPAGVLLSHLVIGLDRLGYGRILGQCTFGAKLFYCLWLTLAKEEDEFVCVPMKPLPDDRKFEETKSYIRSNILGKSIHEIENDEELMEFLTEIGPDTVINAFAVNRRGNSDVKVCNDINMEIFRRLSHTNASKEDIRRIPLLLTQSKLPAKMHGEAASDFKRRLAIIDPNSNTLTFLINTVMNPWVAASNQIEKLGAEFRQTVLDVLGKHVGQASRHYFVLTEFINKEDKVFAEYIPDFSRPMYQYHATALLKFLIHKDAQVVIRKQLEQSQPIILTSVNVAYLEDFLHEARQRDEDVWCFEGFPTAESKPFLKTRIRVKDILRCHRFDLTVKEQTRDLNYFLYGKDGKAFLARTSNYVKSKLDYHQVVQLEGKPYGISSEVLEIGLNVKVKPEERQIEKLYKYLEGNRRDEHLRELNSLLQKIDLHINIADDIFIQTTCKLHTRRPNIWHDMTILNGLSRK